jgi:hypothetical protein
MGNTGILPKFYHVVTPTEGAVCSRNEFIYYCIVLKYIVLFDMQHVIWN